LKKKKKKTSHRLTSLTSKGCCALVCALALTHSPAGSDSQRVNVLPVTNTRLWTLASLTHSIWSVCRENRSMAGTCLILFSHSSGSVCGNLWDLNYMKVC